jgi:hypothetical protein
MRFSGELRLRVRKIFSIKFSEDPKNLMRVIPTKGEKPEK